MTEIRDFLSNNDRRKEIGDKLKEMGIIEQNNNTRELIGYITFSIIEDLLNEGKHYANSTETIFFNDIINCTQCYNNRILKRLLQDTIEYSNNKECVSKAIDVLKNLRFLLDGVNVY